MNIADGDPVARATLCGIQHLEVAFVRHGQPLEPADRSPEEALDPPLTSLGLQQAAAMARYLRGRHVDAVYSSRLTRARLTAESLGLPVDYIDDLQEVGIYSDRIDARSGAAFVAGRRWEAFPSAESSGQFRARVRRAVDDIVRSHDVGDSVVIVCHSGVINAYLADLLGLEQDYFFRPSHGSVTRIWCADGRASVWSLNETAHVSGDLFST